VALDARENKRRYKIMNDLTVEELESELQETLQKIEDIVDKVQNKEMDTFEGFTQSEKYKDRVVEIGNVLKEKGIDITEL
jgi:hypothetical protein